METSNPLNDPNLNSALKYPLEILDHLVMVDLNPAQAGPSGIDHGQFRDFSLQLTEEEVRLQLLINTQVFSLTKKSAIELLLRRYHSSLIILLDQCLENQRRNSKNRLVKELHKTALSCIERLVSFIEMRFFQYLDRKMRAPAAGCWKRYLIFSTPNVYNNDYSKIKIRCREKYLA